MEPMGSGAHAANDNDDDEQQQKQQRRTSPPFPSSASRFAAAVSGEEKTKRNVHGSIKFAAALVHLTRGQIEEEEEAEGGTRCASRQAIVERVPNGWSAGGARSRLAIGRLVQAQQQQLSSDFIPSVALFLSLKLLPLPLPLPLPFG
ncbi:hypothetical protein AXG93_4012s1400 [Marchantia polymorpha subsp. ruderalis]|uniref:Uncharacterized protein n=1 Tax=Marchantia polymorpha subsp. ruderalis TaxID=1480154 RepID=A0A176VJT2_MARPO|nr:hypothetical protein AXG93_4012s1400 [Marchantia polymorpha subsp. ruderalis]